MATPSWLRPSRRARRRIAAIAGASTADVKSVLKSLGKGAEAAGLNTYELATLVDRAAAGDSESRETLVALVQTPEHVLAHFAKGGA